MVNMLQNNRNGNRGNPRRGDRTTSRGEGNKVYVSNIDFSCTHQDLKDAFKQVGEVAFVEMLKDNNQKPKGCAIIRFKDNNIVDEAIRIMNRSEMKGRKLVVKDERDIPKDNRMSKDRKRPREDDHYDRPHTSGGLGGLGLQLGGLDKFGNTYGLSVQFLESLGIDGPLVNRVFVANLDYSVNEETLKEVFEIAGKVTDVELVRGDDGKSKGFGFIEFDHPVEAVQAISMLHNQLYHDRPMSVQLTRKEKKNKDGIMRLPSGLKGIGTGLGINGAPLKDVARTIEAGNQSSLLGVSFSSSAMPSGSGPSLSVGMDMGGLSQGMNQGMGVGMGGGLGGGLQGNMPNVMSANLGSGMGGSLSSNLGSDMNSSLGRSGMGLMDRPSGMPVNMGLSSSLQSSIRNLGDTSSTNSFSNFSGAPLTNQRNVVQITNLPNDYSWKSLQNLCSSFGDVTFAKITSRGVGVVHFENETSARRAVDMLDHQRFEGRYLETRLL